MGLEGLFKIVLSLSFMGSILAILIITAKRIFKNKFSVSWHHYVWLLLIFRLIIPYAPESSLSMFNLFPSIQQKINIVQYANSSSDASTALPAVNGSTAAINDNTNNVNLQNGPYNNETVINVDSVTQKNNITGFNYRVAGVIWLAGLIAMFFYTLFVNVIFILRINKQHECKDETILRKLTRCKSKMKVSDDIPVIYYDSLKTPALYGILRPKILVSHKIMNSLPDSEKEYVFLHELAHLKRKDLLLNWMIVIVQSIHWFNPIVWYAFNKMHEDCEVACDAYVLSRLKPAEHKKYGETIVNLIYSLSKPYWNPVAAGMAKNSHSIKRRIEMIAMFRKNSWKWTIVALAVIIVVGLIGLTGAKDVIGTSKIDVKSDIKPAVTPAVSPDKTENGNNNERNDSSAVKETEGTMKVKIYLIGIEDNGKSGKRLGTGDSVIPVDVSIKSTNAPLSAAINKLLSVKEQFYGQSGLYNTLYRSDLKLDKVSINNGEAEIRLSGSILLGGVMDDPRFKAQIEETALQFNTINKVSIYINNIKIEELLSGKGN